jgi:hypothetical protein
MRDRLRGQPAFAGFDLFNLGVSSRTDSYAMVVLASGIGSEHSGFVNRGVNGYHLDIADPDGPCSDFSLQPTPTRQHGRRSIRKASSA